MTKLVFWAFPADLPPAEVRAAGRRSKSATGPVLLVPGGGTKKNGFLPMPGDPLGFFDEAPEGPGVSGGLAGPSFPAATKGAFLRPSRMKIWGNIPVQKERWLRYPSRAGNKSSGANDPSQGGNKKKKPSFCESSNFQGGRLTFPAVFSAGSQQAASSANKRGGNHGAGGGPGVGRGTVPGAPRTPGRMGGPRPESGGGELATGMGLPGKR